MVPEKKEMEIFKKEILEIENIKKIKVKGSGNLYIDQNDEYKFEIETDENLIDNIKYNITGDLLEIYLDNSNPTVLNYNFNLPDISLVHLEGSVNSIGRGKIDLSKLNVGIFGTSLFYIDSLFVDELIVNIEGDGTLRFAGNNKKNDLNISGIGDLQFLDFPSHYTDLSISGSGRANLNVSDTLIVEILGSGKVDYIGDPYVKQNILGSGSLNKIGD
jgi:hypothetical protein